MIGGSLASARAEQDAREERFESAVMAKMERLLSGEAGRNSKVCTAMASLTAADDPLWLQHPSACWGACCSKASARPSPLGLQ